MATLSADVPVVFDPRYEIGLTQIPCTTTDVYFRGGLAHKVAATGKATLTPADADPYLGVVMEHKSATTADLIWLATSGVFWFTCTNFSQANIRKTFAIQATDLTDNPATLDVTGTGDAGACGTLKTVDAADGAGYLDTNNRFLEVNA